MSYLFQTAAVILCILSSIILRALVCGKDDTCHRNIIINFPLVTHTHKL